MKRGVVLGMVLLLAVQAGCRYAGRTWLRAYHRGPLADMRGRSYW